MALSHGNHATSRLCALGIARSSAVAMVDQVNTWVDRSGPEWAVARLKGLKTAYLHRLTGGDWKPDWVSWRDGAPSGAFRFLWHQPSQKRAIRALNALMIYSSYVAPSATPTQIRKFVGSVVDPPPVKEVLSKEAVSSVKMPRSRREPWSANLDRFPPSPVKRMPVFGRSVTQDDSSALPDAVREARALGYVDLFPSVFSELRDLVLSQPWFTSGREDPCVGKISFIQEPGYKLRAVANPNLIVQTSLRPLQSVIWGLLREIPEDCTFDQEEGVKQVGDWLKDGKTVHSVDLSDATNVFPLGLQMQLLEQALPLWGEHLSLFHRASTGKWAYRDPNTGLRSNLRWKKGQPLGLAPSFGAFAFSHHFVARLARRRAGSGEYRILGDDIVITGDAFLREYRLLLDQLGCPVSESKTISGRVAEFAGKIVTPVGSITTAKWREISDDNFIDVARMLGPRSLPIFRPRQRNVLAEIGELPEFWGGAGWNSRGLPLEDRISRFEILIQIMEKDTEAPVSRLSWTSEYLWSRQAKPRSTGMTPRPEESRSIGVASYRQVVGLHRPLTESAPEGFHLEGYGPAEASLPHTELNLVRWERLLAELRTLEQTEGHA